MRRHRYYYGIWVTPSRAPRLLRKLSVIWANAFPGVGDVVTALPKHGMVAWCVCCNISSHIGLTIGNALA
eukprot:9177017-Pyramimonas_sp.AAC.1